ncbi:MAG: DUF2179 domain-containing protein [Erysipelotrichaceae bacterium]|nr:DUF2179 domain-containing protein [Erysipelotrichaceae bacterium]
MTELVLALCIFLARTVDMSLASFRVIMTVKKKMILASVIGVVEAAIWFVAVQEALSTDSNSVLIVCGYALGFGAGTFLGTYLSNILINDKIDIQIITSSTNSKLIEALREKEYAVTVFDCYGMKNEKNMLYIVADSKKYKEIVEITNKFDSSAFVTANENKYVLNGYFGKRK